MYYTLADWETIRLPKELAKMIDNFVKSKYAKERGYTSKSQVVVNAVRDHLMREKEVTFQMNSKKYRSKLKFKRMGDMIFCQKCRSRVCEHAIHLFKHNRLFYFPIIENGSILSESVD